MKIIRMIEINQPIGTFYIGKMSSTDVINISKVSQRDSMGGHQRQLKNVRAKEISETPSPYKTCHYIARSMNSDPLSPFYKRLKMLEKRESSKQTISQNTFVTNLCQLITAKPQEDEIALKKNEALLDNPKYVFRKYFIRGKDEVILKILHNYFSAAADVFPHEWNNPKDFILTKSVGFEGLISALSVLVPNGETKGDLSKQRFVSVFEQLKLKLSIENIQLSSKYFSSSSQDAKRLSQMIIAAEGLLH